MIKGEAQRDPGAAVVAADSEPREAQMIHQTYLLQCHDALGVGGVVRLARRFVAVTVAAQLWADDRELLRERGCDSVPVACVCGYPCSKSSGGRPARTLGSNGSQHRPLSVGQFEPPRHRRGGHEASGRCVLLDRAGTQRGVHSGARRGALAGV